MKSSSWILSVCLLTLTSCFLPGKKSEKAAQEIELHPVTIQNEYSMGIPGYMTKTKTLNDDASLQFQNIFKEAYVIVIDESKQEFIDALVESEGYDSTGTVITNYADTQVQLTTNNLDVISRTETITLKINGLDAAHTEMDATMAGVPSPITYFLTFIEGNEKLYMVMAWTLQKNKDTHRKTFNKMARSFKTLKNSPLAGDPM